MKILTKIAAILLLLPIVAGYAQAMPSLGLLIERLEMDSAKPNTLDIVPTDFSEVEIDERDFSPDQKGLTPKEARAAAEAANPGTVTLAIEIDRVNENGDALIYKVELDNGVDVQVDASNGSIIGTDAQ